MSDAHQKLPAEVESDDGVTLIDELNATINWLKRTGNLHDASRVQRAVAALEASAVSDATSDSAPLVAAIRGRLTAIMTGASHSQSALDIVGQVFNVVEYIDQRTT